MAPKDPEVTMELIGTFRGGSVAVALLSTLAASACAAGRAEGPVGFGSARGTAREADEPVLLTVDNQDFRDATIYADWNGIIQRVGAVTGKTTRTLSMPWRDYQVRLVVDFLGGGNMRADPIAVGPGEHIDFIIPPGW